VCVNGVSERLRGKSSERENRGNLKILVQEVHRIRRALGGHEVFSFQENPYESELFKILERKVCVGVWIFKRKKLRKDSVFVHRPSTERS
jgi:hypothetical protein